MRRRVPVSDTAESGLRRIKTTGSKENTNRPASRVIQIERVEFARVSSMDLLNREQLEFLSQTRSRSCVSVFLPTHRAGKETLQDSVRLKNLLREAEGQLSAAGVPKLKARELLAPARQLEGRTSFWRHQSDGLALFLAPGFFQYFRLPIQFHA